MGYYDSLNSLKNDVANGYVTAKVEDGELVIEGDTYRHKDFLKSEYRGTTIHWDKDRKAWALSAESLYKCDKERTKEFFGIEIA